MKPISRYLRLLPAVVIVGTSLLVLKGVDIARAAQEPAATSDEPDNSGLAPTDAGGAPPRDFASDDSASSSAGEVDVLSSLTRRRAELDARERAISMRENLLTAGEGRVDQKIGALKALQAQMQSLLVQRDAAQAAQIASLIKSYGPDGMKPAQAAAIFNTMPDDVLLPIAKGMKPGDLGTIMAKMNPDAAQKLTVKLATMLKLPESSPALCPTTPGTQADLTSPVPGATNTIPPLQTAALSPPGSTPVVTPLPPPAATPAAAPPAPAPTQASMPPAKPTAPPVHHPAPAKPTAPPPAKPMTASAPPPAKPTIAAATPPAKPAIAAATPPASPATTPAAPTATPPAAPIATPPAKPAIQAASGPPVTITPPPGG
ncbi:MAG TPA: hypothetical protein VHZ78_04535 [Rhizomicrobium sp.]|jgi:flagellar motility protein MotE (MotC chaperone)|nr:hypothetical protein [Rhizomicrobium sp.]